jgi:hypothetical protein
LPGLLTPERTTYSWPYSQNFMRQSITALWSVILSDLCTVPVKINRKSNCRPMNFIPFEVFSMGVSLMSWFHRSWTEKRLFGFLLVMHDTVDPLWARTVCPYFWAKWTEPPPKCVYHLEVSQMSHSSWQHRCAELQTIRGNWIMVWRVRWKQIRCRMTEPPGFSKRQLISTIGLETFHSESRVIYQSTCSGIKSFNTMTDWSGWSWWTTAPLVIRC